MEAAFAHGYLSATQKGHAQKRARDRRRDYDEPTAKGPDIGGWKRLAAMFPDRVQHGGERLVQ